MAENRKYDQEYKEQAVKLAQEIGTAKAADELGIPRNTIYGWMRAVRHGQIDVRKGAHSLQSALTLNEEMIETRKRMKELERENKRLKEENEILAETCAFFAESRRRSQKG